MAKSDAKKLGTFIIFALILAGILGWFYFTGRTLTAATGAGVDVGKAALLAGVF